MKQHITSTRASRAEFRPLNNRRKAEMTQAPAWVTLAGIAALVAVIYYATP